MKKTFRYTNVSVLGELDAYIKRNCVCLLRNFNDETRVKFLKKIILIFNARHYRIFCRGTLGNLRGTSGVSRNMVWKSLLFGMQYVTKSTDGKQCCKLHNILAVANIQYIVCCKHT
jgi:hypothetical protein